MKKKAKVFKKPRNLKMSKRKERGLDRCIEHWFRVRDEDEKATSTECELCEKFMCHECPVHRKSGAGCMNTPFDDYYAYHRKRDRQERKRKRLAQAEIDFLQTCYY